MLIHRTELPTEVRAILEADGTDPYDLGVPVAEQIDAVRIGVFTGALALYYVDPVVFMLRARTPHVGDLHISLRPGGNVFGIMRAARKFLKWAPVGTSYHKLEARTPNAALAAVCMRCGAHLEGIRRESALVDGVFVDEYEMGYILRRDSVAH